MSKSAKRKAIISFEVYPFDCAVFIGHSDEEVEKELRDIGLDLSSEELEAIRMEGDGRSAMLEGGQSVLRLKKLSKVSMKDMGVLSHEVFHVVDFLFERIGLQLTRSSDEAYAYMIQYLTKKVLEIK